MREGEGLRRSPSLKRFLPPPAQPLVRRRRFLPGEGQRGGGIESPNGRSAILQALELSSKAARLLLRLSQLLPLGPDALGRGPLGARAGGGPGEHPPGR